MKSPREKFEEEYIAVQVPADNKDGFTVKYVYYAPWYIWDLPEQALKKEKRMLLILSILSFLVYLIAGVQYTEVNSHRMTLIFGSIALCAQILETTGALRFWRAGYRTERSTYRNVNLILRVAPGMRGICTGILGITGAFYLSGGRWKWDTLISSAGYLICSSLSVCIFLGYRKIPFRTEKNETLKEKAKSIL